MCLLLADITMRPVLRPISAVKYQAKTVSEQGEGEIKQNLKDISSSHSSPPPIQFSQLLPYLSQFLILVVESFPSF